MNFMVLDLRGVVILHLVKLNIGLWSCVGLSKAILKYVLTTLITLHVKNNKQKIKDVRFLKFM